MNAGEEVDGESKDRVAALTDGIYAVAMTLLVIDLKLPETIELRHRSDLTQALVALEPKITTWAVSFFVLALFYMGNLRSMRSLRALDGPLVTLALHPSLLRTPAGNTAARAGRFRTIAVLAISVASVPVSLIWPGSGQAVFLLMLLVIPLSKRLEKAG